eukprot:SAG31_NODE_172_length_21357_cov_7.616021_2_plen_106_part_00
MYVMIAMHAAPPHVADALIILLYLYSRSTKVPRYLKVNDFSPTWPRGPNRLYLLNLVGIFGLHVLEYRYMYTVQDRYVLTYGRTACRTATYSRATDHTFKISTKF